MQVFVDEKLIPLIKVPSEEKATDMSRHFSLGALIWLCVHAAAHNLLIRYSRARIVEDMFFSSVAVFFSEIVKLLLCLIMISGEDGGIIRRIKKQIIEQPWDTLKVCIPAMLYTIQNNLSYTAATHLDAATFAIVSQLKIFAAVIFSIILLQRHPTWIQYFSFIILFSGVSLVQLQTTTNNNKNNNSSVSKIEQNPIFGFLIACIACGISGFAGIFLEKILKGSAPVSLWMRNIQMSIFSIPASLAATFIQDGNEIAKNGFLFGFDSVVWFTVFWYGIGGLVSAICIKYAGTIAKDFSTSFAIILSTVGSVYIFNFHPNLLFILGTVLVIFSIFLYSSSDLTLKKIYKNLSINIL